MNDSGRSSFPLRRDSQCRWWRLADRNNSKVGSPAIGGADLLVLADAVCWRWWQVAKPHWLAVDAACVEDRNSNPGFSSLATLWWT